MVVLPASDAPANRNALPLRIALAECSKNPPCLASVSVCTIRRTESIEYGFAVCRIHPLRFAGSHSARKSPRVKLQRLPCCDTHTSASASAWPGGTKSISNSMSEFPADVTYPEYL